MTTTELFNASDAVQAERGHLRDCLVMLNGLLDKFPNDPVKVDAVAKAIVACGSARMALTALDEVL